MIISKGNLHLDKKGELSSFYTLYYNWVVSIFSNVGITTSNAVKMDWFPRANNTPQ